ncbi:glycosyltransferase family 2 protein [Mucilaginibacter sp.]
MRFFSLIIATINRVEPLEHLLISLINQSFKDFDVIIVDQNLDNRLDPVLVKFNLLNITHLKSEKGLSKARNLGILNSKSNFVVYPDDDCWYEPDLLLQIYKQITENNLDGITCVARDENKNLTLIPFINYECFVTKNKVWLQAISFTIFVKRYDDIIFDEDLGLGTNTKYIACEETDYLLKILKEKHAKIKFSPSLFVYHPKPLLEEVPTWKIYGYSLAIGLMHKRYEYSIYKKVKLILRPFSGMILMCLIFKPGKAKFYWYSVKGRLIGMLS